MKQVTKNKQTKERGSVTLFVLITMMFFLMIVIFSYTKQAEKINAQKALIARIQSQYTLDNIEKIYYELESKQPVISLYKANGELYNPTDWANEDLTLKILYPGGIADSYKYYYVDGIQNKYEEGIKISKSCTIKVEYTNDKKEEVIVKMDKIVPTATLSPNGGNVYTMPTAGNATINTTLSAQDTGESRSKSYAICMGNI